MRIANRLTKLAEQRTAQSAQTARELELALPKF
jgi:hypothetical protein